MKILALDLSTHASGCAILQDGELLGANCITSSSNDLYKRIHIMVDTIDELLQNLDIDMIIMEEVIPDHVKNVNTYKALSYLQAYLMITLHDKHPKIPTEFVYPGSWRSKVGIQTGRGIKRETLKSADIMRANELFPQLQTTSDDIADAVLIGASYFIEKANPTPAIRNWSKR